MTSKGRNFQDTDYENLVVSFERRLKEAAKTLRLDLLARVEERVADVKIKPSALVNEIANSDVSWSKDAFENAGITPATAGDPNQRCYNFYRHTRATTLLVEDDAHSLKNAAHSLYAANEGANADIPDWDRTNGFARFGHKTTSYTIDTPLQPGTIIRPGSVFYWQLIASLESAFSFPAACQLSIGLHDNTVGQQKYLEGADIALAAAMTGAVGAVSLDYFIVATDDWGLQVKSNVQNVANANAALDANNFVSLAWSEVPGAVDYSIYKKNNGSGIYYLVFQVQNGALTYYDTGSFLKTVAGFPVVTDTKAKAYVETDAGGETIFNPETGLWKIVPKILLPLRIPSTYNSSVTTGKVWLRVGLTAPTTAAADQRKILLDHLGLARVDGAWQESPLDKNAKSPVSTAMTQSSQGDSGSDTGGSDGRQCPALTTLITVVGRGGVLLHRQARFLKAGDVVVAPEGVGVVSAVRRTRAQVGYELVTRRGHRLVASPTTPIITHQLDNRGTPICKLKAGDRILVFNERKNSFNCDRIKSIMRRRQAQVFLEISLAASRHRYVAGGVCVHNLKQFLPL